MWSAFLRGARDSSGRMGVGRKSVGKSADTAA
jgi:hypothetical protein